MAVLTVYARTSDSGSLMSMNNGAPSWSAASNPNAGRSAIKGVYDYISYWAWDLTSLPANAIVSAASASLAISTETHTNPTTWYYQDTNAQQAAPIGTLYSGGFTTAPSLSPSRVQLYRASTLWFRVSNAYWMTATSPAYTDYVQWGNNGSNSSITVTYNQPPSAPAAITSPTAGQNVSAGSVNLTTTGSTDPNADVITYYWEYSVDGVTGWTAIGSTTSLTLAWNTSALANGNAYKVRVRAIDLSGSNTYSAYTTSSAFTIQNAQIIRPMKTTMFASDSFNRANGNLSGSNTDSATGGTARVWITASNTPANDATNLQIVGNQLKRTLVEPANAWFDVGVVSRQQIRAKIVTMPVAGDFVQLWVRAEAPVGAAVPQNGVRANLSSDGSIQVQRVDAGATTILYQSAAGFIAAGNTVGFIVGATEYWLLKDGLVVSTGLHSKNLAGLTRAVLRFNGAAGSAAVIDDFAVEEFLDEGIASSEAFGNPTVVRGAVTLQPGGIATAEEFGNPTLQRLITILPPSIASAEAFGNATISNGWPIFPTGIPSAEAFGNPTVVRGAVTLQPLSFMGSSNYGLGTDDFEGGIGGWQATSAEGAIAEGNVSRRGTKSLLLTSVNGNTMGAIPVLGNRVAVSQGQTVIVNGYVRARDAAKNARLGIRWYDAGGANIGTSSPAGTATSLTDFQLRTFSSPAPANAAFAAAFLNVTNPDGAGQGWFFDDITIWNADEGMGTPHLAFTQFLLPSSIASAEAFGNPTLNASIILLPTSIASSEVFGDVTIVIGPVTLVVSGIPSAEAFGIPFVKPPGVPLIFADSSFEQVIVVEAGEIELVQNAGYIEIVPAEEHVVLQEEW